MYMMKNCKHSRIDKQNALKCIITITWKWFVAHWLWLGGNGRTAVTKLVWWASNPTQSIQRRGGWKPGYHWQVTWALWNRKLWWRWNGVRTQMIPIANMMQGRIQTVSLRGEMSVIFGSQFSVGSQMSFRIVKNHGEKGYFRRF